MLNIVAVMGRLARDPEMRQTTSGKSVASFTIACDRGRKDANGQSVCDWLNIVAWDKTAEFVCKYFQKGSMIAIDGRLQTRQYQDKTGQNRTAVEIVANNVSFAGSKNADTSVGGGVPDAPKAPAPRTQGEPDAAPPAYSQGQTDDFALIEDAGDLPF